LVGRLKGALVVHVARLVLFGKPTEQGARGVLQAARRERVNKEGELG
jgi:hypothetical protein